MKDLLRRLASKLPVKRQQELKRLYFGRQINKDCFVSGEPEFGRVGQWVEKGDWVLDIGANVGHYTKAFSDIVGPSGRVFAFEPVPETFELLVANSAQFEHRNVSLLNFAASDRTAYLGLNMPKFDTGLENYYRAELAETTADLNTVTVAIDQLDLPNTIRLAKIDVEGHEIFVLNGMKKIIKRDRPILIVEGNSQDIESLLQKFGYEYMTYDQSPNRVYKYAGSCT